MKNRGPERSGRPSAARIGIARNIERGSTEDQNLGALRAKIKIINTLPESAQTPDPLWKMTGVRADFGPLRTGYPSYLHSKT